MITTISSNLDWTCPKCSKVYCPLTTECFSCNAPVVHPKQCRRLVKKELRRIWLHMDELHNLHEPKIIKYQPTTKTVTDPDKWLEFIEVIKK